MKDLSESRVPIVDDAAKEETASEVRIAENR